MKIRKKGAAGRTPEKLLAAASRVFAKKGYRDATIAEISDRARANVAAVNYHFGDKETLYKESWRHSFSESVKAHPPGGGVSDDAPPEERLRGHVTALLHRIADKANNEFRIVQKELANPTGLLEEAMNEELRPLHEAIESIVLELLGLRRSNQQVQFCVVSIIAQCINPIVATARREENCEGKGGSPVIDDIEAYSNHVVTLSLAGIRTIRDESEKKRSGSKRRRISGKAFTKE